MANLNKDLPMEKRLYRLTQRLDRIAFLEKQSAELKDTARLESLKEEKDLRLAEVNFLQKKLAVTAKS